MIEPGGEDSVLAEVPHQPGGALGVADTNAQHVPPWWTAGQNGDGYSWIVQIMPYFEETTIYDKLVQSANPRLGRLADAAFGTGTLAPTQNPGKAPVLAGTTSAAGVTEEAGAADGAGAAAGRFGGDS